MELGRPAETGKLNPPTLISKRKRAAPSPTSSANFVIGENSVQVVRDFDADLEAFSKKLDADDWSFVNTQIFIQIMLEEARKEQGFNSRKKRVFNDLQWRVIYNELLVRTGKTGYTPKKGDPGAAMYRQKGLDHYDQLQELLESSLANGALGQPSSLKPPTSEEEVAMYEVGKAIKREDSVSIGKRKSDGSGGTNSKSMRYEKKETAYEKTAFANQMRGEYYGLLADSRRALEACSIPKCLALLEEIKPIIGTQQYLKAYNKLLSEESQRRGFVSIKPETRVDWANDL
ncbi:hypothetical protein RHSIM_Rhsim03G0116000 [Rhododendron simsii]|uniref:Myb/SANT-like domain-containing protein n=1 Tax=Rhododendron simsii TaxID=118357 RepID=A0A834LUJ8_RHOSS|nr:hypothetical protein RHSIM_Rhsim03G0116000 [Rhododendron simsii]